MSSNVQQLYQIIDERIGNEEETIALEGLIQLGPLLADGTVPSPIREMEKEDIRKAIQLVLLKAMKSSVQMNHQMTPDAIGLLMSYLAEKWMDGRKEVTVLDPVVGTGNLLYTVLHRLPAVEEAYGIEVDELLIRVAATVGELSRQPVRFFLQDSLHEVAIDPVDLIIADLPIGYYPDEEHALNYRLMPTEGQAYAHHLLIEQSVERLKDDGIALFLIPNDLFSSEQSDVLHPYFKEEAHITALFQLPPILFKDQQLAKSILVVERRTDEKVFDKEVLLAPVPDMTDEGAMRRFFQRVNRWFEEKKELDH